jgi:hypothetical protein
LYCHHTLKEEVIMATNKMTVQQAGSEGGKARADKYSHEELSEQARRSAETVEREQPGFHAKIGQKGGSSPGKQRENENEKNR